MLHLGRKTAGWAAVAALGAGVMMGGSAAKAAVITDTAPINPQSDFTDTGADIFVPQFDPSLGR